jgi:hypothetical protein
MTRKPPREFVLDTDTGTFTRGNLYNEKESGQSGFADVRRIGVWRPRKRFVALFTDGTSPILQIDSHRFDLSDTTLTVTRQRMLPMLKLFQILRRDVPVESFWYWWSDWYQQPDSEVLDIFFFVFVHLASPAQCERFVTFWNSTAKGNPPWMTKESQPAGAANHSDEVKEKEDLR